mgnify:CR=1 FL=1
MGKKYVQMIVSGEVSNIKLTAVVIRRDELMEWGETLVNTDGEYVMGELGESVLFWKQWKNYNT